MRMNDLARIRWIIVVLTAFVAALCTCIAGCGARHGFEQRLLDRLSEVGVTLRDGSEANAANSDDRHAAALPVSGPITLADLFAVAEASSPRLAAARSEIGVAAGQVWQASLYPNPRAEINAEEIPLSSGGGVDDGIVTVSVTQPIVVGGRLKAASRAAEAEEAATRARLQLTVRETFGEIASLHARIIANRQTEALYAELAQLGGEALGVAKARFEARAAPETDVIRPQIELAQIELVRARLAKERAAAVKQLSILLGGVPVDDTRLVGEISDEPPAVDFETLAASVRSAHPALTAAEREADAAEARLERIKAERVPDIDVSAGAGYHGEMEHGIVQFGVGAMLPLWDNREGDMLSARFAVLRARQQRAAIEQDVLRQLAEAHGNYEAARAQLAIMREQIVPAAARSFEQAQEAYRAGRTPFLDLIDAQRTLTEARATLMELATAAALARAEMMTIAGELGANELRVSTADAPSDLNITSQTTKEIAP